jgi:hypothetical protein
MNVVDIEGRLENWGVAMRSGAVSYKSAESLEGNYRSPQQWDAPVTPERALVLVDDALAIENAVCALTLYDHLLLKSWYVRRWSRWKCLGVALRGSGLPRSKRLSFDDSMLLAKVHLLAELQRPATTRKVRAVAYARRVLGLTPHENEE